MADTHEIEQVANARVTVEGEWLRFQDIGGVTADGKIDWTAELFDRITRECDPRDAAYRQELQSARATLDLWKAACIAEAARVWASLETLRGWSVWISERGGVRFQSPHSAEPHGLHDVPAPQHHAYNHLLAHGMSADLLNRQGEKIAALTKERDAALASGAMAVQLRETLARERLRRKAAEQERDDAREE